MQMLLAFAPFIAFALLSRTLPVTLALAVAALVAIGQAVNDVVRHRRSLKILEVGTALLFGGLAVLAWLRAASGASPRCASGSTAACSSSWPSRC